MKVFFKLQAPQNCQILCRLFMEITLQYIKRNLNNNILEWKKYLRTKIKIQVKVIVFLLHNKKG